MLPDLTIRNVGNVDTGHIVPTPYSCECLSAKQLTNFQDLLLTKFGAIDLVATPQAFRIETRAVGVSPRRVRLDRQAVRGPFGGASTLIAVQTVVNSCPQQQMCGVPTWRVVTSVPDQLSNRHLSFVDDIGYNMSTYWAPLMGGRVPQGEVPIPVSGTVPRPNPTFAGAPRNNLLQEA